MKPAVIALVTLLFSLLARADLMELRFSSFNQQAGLPQNVITALHQDRQGYLWVGTQEGLSRYDGYRFDNFFHDSQIPTSLGGDWVHDIGEDPHGSLWVANEQGLSVLDPGRTSFRHFRHLPNRGNSLNHNRVRKLLWDRKGTLWLATDRGLNRYRPQTRDFARYFPEADHAMARARALAEDADGNIWIGADGGICRLTPATDELAYCGSAKEPVLDLPSYRIKAMHLDPQQRLWLGTFDQGVVRIDLATMAVAHFPAAGSGQTISGGPINNYVRAIMADRSGNLWFATNGGLSRWLGDGQFQNLRGRLNERDGLGSNHLTQLLQDRSGLLWIGSYNGLFQANPSTQAIRHHGLTRNQLPDMDLFINALAQTSYNDLWAGTPSGLHRIDVATGRRQTYLADDAGLVSDFITSLHGDGIGGLWVGTRHHGLSHFDPATGRFEALENAPGQPGGLPAAAVTDMTTAPDGTFWVTTFGGGLARWHPRGRTFEAVGHRSDEAISSGQTMSVLASNDGTLWIGTLEDGLNLYQPETDQARVFKYDPRDPDSLSNNMVNVVLEDRRGDIWVGTQRGLNRLHWRDRQQGLYRFQRYGRSMGLPSVVIQGLIEDERGWIWASTNNGLVVIEPATDAIQILSTSHGLLENEFNHGAYLRALDGTLYFGGPGGLTGVPQDELLKNERAPKLHLRKISFSDVQGEELMPERGLAPEQLVLDHRMHKVAFDFVALDFWTPHKNRYRYRLVGVDATWTETRRRSVSYTRLPPGHYRFELQGSNGDGAWNEEAIFFEFSVLPAPWLSPWAYLGYATLTLLLLWAFLRQAHLRQERINAYQAKLEQEVQRRTGELQALNQKLLETSSTDPLTGLRNRRFLVEIVEKESDRVLRDIRAFHHASGDEDSDYPRLFFMSITLDQLRGINDLFGQRTGDRILMELARVLQRHCRQADTLVRWKGNAFVVMGWINRIPEAEQLAGRLYEAVNRQASKLQGELGSPVTTSLGFSFYPFARRLPHWLDWQQALDMAIRARRLCEQDPRRDWCGVTATELTPPRPESLLKEDLNQLVEQGTLRLLSNKVLPRGTLDRNLGGLGGHSPAEYSRDPS